MLVLFLMASMITVTHAAELGGGGYNFVCADGGRYLNVYAGKDADGTNVCVWERDGSPEQNYTISDCGGGKYKLHPASSSSRVIDVNRGNSYDNPLKAGLNVDLWRTNDAPAQEFYITHVGNAFSDVTDTKLEDSISTLSQFSIINGYEDGTFKPKANITRAEFAKIICKTFLFETTEIINDEFIDVSKNHWARDYIYTTKKLGIINGTSPTTFAPDDNITYEQAIKMVVASLGYNEETTQKGGYPEGYIMVADELVLLDNIEYDAKEFATRENIAFIVENALHAPFYFLSESEGTVVREEAVDTLYKIHFFLVNEVSTDDEDSDSVG